MDNVWLISTTGKDSTPTEDYPKAAKSILHLTGSGLTFIYVTEEPEYFDCLDSGTVRIKGSDLIHLIQSYEDREGISAEKKLRDEIQELKKKQPAFETEKARVDFFMGNNDTWPDPNAT
ncbi:MAG: hypothetical protein GY938_13085 [Ketobacter sp.]|nr:hypothetical protein [Ketobacter sp.]